jgi:hypothetical protein
MAGSSTEERGKRARENGEQRKWEHRERKKKGREREIVKMKKKKKNLKKGLVCPFFYSMKCEKLL